MSERERNSINDNNLINIKGNAKNNLRQTSEERDSTDYRVMRCFCGCTTLTREQIEHILTMSVSTLLVHQTAKTMLQNFFRIGYTTEKSEAMILLECHDMCNRILSNENLIYDQYMMNDLLGLCPTYAWEQKITTAVRNITPNAKQEIAQALNELKLECIYSIESHNDYDRFRRELLRKIRK